MNDPIAALAQRLIDAGHQVDIDDQFGYRLLRINGGSEFTERQFVEQAHRILQIGPQTGVEAHSMAPFIIVDGRMMLVDNRQFFEMGSYPEPSR